MRGVVLRDKADDEASDGTADHAHEHFHGSGVDRGAVHVQDFEPEFVWPAGQGKNETEEKKLQVNR